MYRRVYLGLQSPERESTNDGRSLAVSDYSRKLSSHLQAERESNWKWGEANIHSQPTSSDKSPKTTLLTGSQVSKYVSLWETFSFRTPQTCRRKVFLSVLRSASSMCLLKKDQIIFPRKSLLFRPISSRHSNQNPAYSVSWSTWRPFFKKLTACRSWKGPVYLSFNTLYLSWVWHSFFPYSVMLIFFN